MTDSEMEATSENNFLSSPELTENFYSDSYIKDYFSDKVVFLTGGLGFLGKLVIVKLLKCDVRKIYLLARAKKGKSIEERLEILKTDPVSASFQFTETFKKMSFQVFKKLLKQNGKVFEKLNLIEGDLKQIGLGISSESRLNLIREVEIVFHVAADVRFDESLREATETNVRGTREIMLLSQQMQNLNVFVYVSTAFCTPGFYVKEQCENSKCLHLICVYQHRQFSVYKMNLDPDFMIKFVEQLHSDDYDAFEAVARRIIQPYPNTYTYTKALAEHVVRKYGSNMNIAIVRPSIVTTTFYDPIPGYTDNVYGGKFC